VPLLQDDTPNGLQAGHASRHREGEPTAVVPQSEETNLRMGPNLQATAPSSVNGNDTPWFVNSNIFHTLILNSETADAVFATRFRQVISDPRAPQPSHLLRVDYADNKALMALVESSVPWPSRSHARFLIEAALKYLSRCQYIVSRDVTQEGLAQAFLDPAAAGSVLRCKYWALFALGELYTARAAVIQSYPGMAYFAQASKILVYPEERPDTETIETLLLLVRISFKHGWPPAETFVYSPSLSTP
jgi:proline utilization trans-activator